MIDKSYITPHFIIIIVLEWGVGIETSIEKDVIFMVASLSKVVIERTTTIRGSNRNLSMQSMMLVTLGKYISSR